MKKIRIFIYSICTTLLLIAGSQTHADFSGFVEQLTTMNIPINKILSQTGITRYEITRLLNAVECKDCIVPNDDYINRYTNPFRKQFSTAPGRDFDDILYKQALYNKKSYYYCVAYVGDKEYMRGYPEATSPVCAGEFCGKRYTTKAEFLQVIMNIIAKYLYPMYSLNWKAAQTWIEDLRTSSYEYKTFSKDDLGVIKKRAKECKDQTCSLQSAGELNVYLKYCMFNLKSCGMIPFNKIKEGYWPVAELNVLYSQQMISLNDAVKYNIGSLVDGKLAIEILEKINSMIGCSFNNDYDCDGIDNSFDSCSTTYNPQQKDFDHDGIGDACDDDIDNDSIKNPIGIVDDNGNINISLWSPTMDNCLFLVNKDQADINKNSIGDACEQQGQNLSLSIAVQRMEGTLPKTVTFGALSKGPVDNLQWDFGDGSVGSGASISHTYFSPGLYTIRLVAKGKNTNDAFAKTTVIVGRDTSEKQGLQLLNTELTTDVGGVGNFTLSTLGNHDNYQWIIGDETTITTSPLLKKKFSKTGTFPISVKTMYKGNIVAATIFTFGVGGNSYGSALLPSTIFPEKYGSVKFQTMLSNISSSDISTILWNFGEGETEENQSTTMTHNYQSIGKKVILQTIILRDGTKIQNMITIFVGTSNLFSSYSIQLLPSTLDVSTLKSFSLKALPIGDSFSDTIFANIIAGDGSSKNFPITKKLSFPLESNLTYRNPGIYYPQTTISLDQCSQLSAQATLAVNGQDFCLQAKLNGSLLDFVCDMDKDGIPDICDTDIDGDGISNLLGTINPNASKTCNYLETLSNKENQTLINTDRLKLHFKGICTLDNAPYTPNTDQLDNNRNGIGDAMEKEFDTTTITNFAPIIDLDGDGIVDSQDLCPSIPELQNGITDFDGCPEIGVEEYCDNNNNNISDGGLPGGGLLCGNGEQDPGETCQTCPQDIENCLFITTPTCLQCPCPFSDIDSNLTNNDQVKAVLRDKEKKYPWGYSLGLGISY